MNKMMADLLATDKIASQFGVALNPKLRAAIEADLRFPSKAASPRPDAEQMQGQLPENVTRLLPATDPRKRHAG